MIAIGGCTHTDSYTTSATNNAPLDNSIFHQVTYGPVTDTSYRWTADGQALFYRYADGTSVGGIDCFAIVAALGGTRQWQYCDTRGSHADSVVEYPAAALSPSGAKLLLLEAVYRDPGPFAPITQPISSVIWLTDTLNPAGHRRAIGRFPTTIAGDFISWLGQPQWIDEEHFIFIAEKYVGVHSQFFPEMHFLALGTLVDSVATFSKIAGTDSAAQWTRAPDGSLLFLRGNWYDFKPEDEKPIRRVLMDSVVVQVPLAGGTPQIVAITPQRLAAVECSGGTCLSTDYDDSCSRTICTRGEPYSIDCHANPCTVGSSRFYSLDPVTWKFTQIPTAGNPYVFPTRPRPGPNGNQFAYLAGSRLYAGPFTKP